MPQITKILCYQTPDGNIHKTELDAKIHLYGYNAKLRCVCDNITYDSKEQRKAREEMKSLIKKNNPNQTPAQALRIRELQSEIAHRSALIRTEFRQKALLLKRGKNGNPTNHFTKGM